MTPILELKNVYRTFGERQKLIPVLQDVSFKVAENEIVCLVGESGCGKTTTGKIISGVLPASRGQILFEGRDITNLEGEDFKAYRRAVQMIHQDPYASLNPAHTVEAILRFPLRRHRIARGEEALHEKIIELMEMVDLTPPDDLLNKFPHQLSGGQRQRVSVARTLTVSPRLIVADEAVSMVDVSIRISLLKMLTNLKEEFGITFVFITHDLAIARYFAVGGRIAVMYLGRVVEIGPTDDICLTPKHPYTRALLSAIPEPDPELTRSKKRIELRSQDIPNLLNLPAGCSFHPRCPWYEENTCEVTVPPLTPLEETGREVACHLLARGDTLEL